MKSNVSAWLLKNLAVVALLFLAMASMSYSVTTHVETDKITADEFWQGSNKVLDTTDNTTMTSYVDAQDTTYNTSIKTYVDAVTVLRDGTNALTANWNIGSFSILGGVWHNSTNMAATNGYFTNLYGLSDINIENNLDGTGYTITGGTLTDGTLSITSGSMTGVAGITATGNLDIGAHDFRALTYTSDVATGTAPLTIASTTVVANLNSSYANEAHSMDWVGLKSWPPAASTGYAITQLEDSLVTTYFGLDGAKFMETFDAMEYSLINGSWYNATNAAFTNAYVTNMYGLFDINLESNLDGTGKTITGGTLTDGTMQCTGGDCTGIDDMNVTELYATGNITVNGILMDSDEVIWLGDSYIHDNGTALIIGRS